MQFKSRKVVLTTLCLVALGLPNFSWALDEFNLHISAGISPNTLLYRFTKEKGFYREEGLEVLPIQAGMLPGIQGLVAGNFHASQILVKGPERFSEDCRSKSSWSLIRARLTGFSRAKASEHFRI